LRSLWLVGRLAQGAASWVAVAEGMQLTLAASGRSRQCWIAKVLPAQACSACLQPAAHTCSQCMPPALHQARSWRRWRARSARAGGWAASSRPAARRVSARVLCRLDSWCGCNQSVQDRFGMLAAVSSHPVVFLTHVHVRCKLVVAPSERTACHLSVSHPAVCWPPPLVAQARTASWRQWCETQHVWPQNRSRACPHRYAGWISLAAGQGGRLPAGRVGPCGGCVGQASSCE